MKAITSIGFAVFLGWVSAGCTARMNARDSVEQSLEMYQYCISQHPQDPSPCEDARQIYEDDLRAYKAESQGEP